MFRHKHARKPFRLIRVGPASEETTLGTFARRAEAERTLAHYQATDAEDYALADLERRELHEFTYRVDEARD